MEVKALELMLYRVNMLTSNHGQRVNRWTHSLKSASSVIERNKEGGVYREIKVASSSYFVDKERKTGVVTCLRYYDRRKLVMQ